MALRAWIDDKGSPASGNCTRSFAIWCIIVQDALTWRYNYASRICHFPITPTCSWISPRVGLLAIIAYIPAWLFILATDHIWHQCGFGILISFCFSNFQIFYFFRSQKNGGLRLISNRLDKVCFSSPKRNAFLVLCGFSHKKLARFNRISHVYLSLWFTLGHWFSIQI